MGKTDPKSVGIFIQAHILGQLIHSPTLSRQYVNDLFLAAVWPVCQNSKTFSSEGTLIWRFVRGNIIGDIYQAS